MLTNDASNDNKSEAPRNSREAEHSTKDSCSAINSCFRLSSTLQIEEGNKLLRKILILFVQQMANEVVLLDFETSPFATRVRIALEEKGIEYKSKVEDLSNKSSTLLKMNPVNQQIPVLIHNGRPICESMIIVQYIDEVWSHKPSLLPSDPYRRAHARFWADYIDKKMYPTGKNLWASKGELKESSKKELIQCFKILEEELGDKLYFGDESFGYIDLAFISFYSLFYTFETLGNWSMAAEFPKLVEWGERCLRKESVSKSTSDQKEVYEVVLQIKQELGIE
ncbi:hypothetical protein POTOM_039838 [Populus tomentosa]|uniref:glutathione transferase n=1 Tax=Populus tomentosa TaxID=118781 RepID=A0A8X8CJF2_POPTO|nr:hypothetical protein POTOM_039838 [Populus tomentosa]